MTDDLTCLPYGQIFGLLGARENRKSSKYPALISPMFKMTPVKNISSLSQSPPPHPHQSPRHYSLFQLPKTPPVCSMSHPPNAVSDPFAPLPKIGQRRLPITSLSLSHSHSASGQWSWEELVGWDSEIARLHFWSCYGFIYCTFLLAT